MRRYWLCFCIATVSLLILGCSSQPEPAPAPEPAPTAPAAEPAPGGTAANDPSGTWTGDWGPSERDRNDVTLQLTWDGSMLTGTVNPGPNAITLTNSTFDPATGAIKMEADAQGRGGATIHYVIEGRVEGNMMSGSWNHPERQGDFRLTKS